MYGCEPAIRFRSLSLVSSILHPTLPHSHSHSLPLPLLSIFPSKAGRGFSKFPVPAVVEGHKVSGRKVSWLEIEGEGEGVSITVVVVDGAAYTCIAGVVAAADTSVYTSVYWIVETDSRLAKAGGSVALDSSSQCCQLSLSPDPHFSASIIALRLASPRLASFRRQFSSTLSAASELHMLRCKAAKPVRCASGRAAHDAQHSALGPVLSHFDLEL